MRASRAPRLAHPRGSKAKIWYHLAAFKPGGGYVFANVHNIQGDVPPENVEALFDAAYEYGFYD